MGERRTFDKSFKEQAVLRILSGETTTINIRGYIMRCSLTSIFIGVKTIERLQKCKVSPGKE